MSKDKKRKTNILRERRRNHITKYIVFIFLLAIVAIYLFQVKYYWHYVNDDAYITYRYSRLLATGNGPYYNIGEHVEGYTNFSLMLLLALVVHFLGEDLIVVVAKLLGATCGVFCVILAFILCRLLIKKANLPSLSAGLWGLGAAGLVAINPTFSLYSTSGLETILFSFCLTLAIFLGTLEASRERWMASGLVFGLATLTRPEGILLFAFFSLSQAIIAIIKTSRYKQKQHRLWHMILSNKAFRICLVNSLVVVTIFALHVLFRYMVYDGEWLPNTYYAKAGGFWAISAYTYISKGIISPFFGFLGIILSLSGLFFMQGEKSLYIPLGVISCIACLLPFITGTDWMPGERLVIPYLPFVASFVVSGWGLLLSKITGRRALINVSIVLAFLIFSWFNQNKTRQVLHNFTYLRARGYQTGHTALAKWLKEGVAKPGDTIALMDIGIIGYLCIDQFILDLTGLTDRFIAKSKGGFLHKTYDTQYILGRRPEFIVLVITAPGVYYRPPPANTPFTFWTKVEQRIYQDPEFQKQYIHHSSSPSIGHTWLDKVARKIGAEKIFKHDYPRKYYLLTVFRRKADRL